MNARSFLPFSALLSIVLSPAATFAQAGCPKGRCTELDETSTAPNYGSFAFGRGPFETVTLAGRSGGTIETAYITADNRGDCSGFATVVPDHLLVLDEDVDDMSLALDADGSVTLVVQTPTGWLCDAGGRTPELRGAFDAGTYRVWVASARQNTWYDYDLHVVDERPATSANLRVELDAAASVPSRQSVVLDRTEPRIALSATAGGTVDASYLPATHQGPCVGFTNVEPAHMVTLTERDSDVLFTVDASADVTLMVHGPHGWLCNDDADGYLPAISGSLRPGSYRVWVGTYRAGERVPYTFVAELDDHLRPDPVPAPTPMSLRFTGRFEAMDVAFTGRDADEIFNACRTFGAGSDGFDWVDEVTIDGRTARTSGYWETDQLCAIAALNAVSEARGGQPVVTGTIESAPFALGGSRSSIERALRTYVPYLEDGWVDDITVNGEAIRNSASYWDAAAIIALITGRVVDTSARWSASGTIESVPFSFAGDSPDDIRAQCVTFFGSVLSDAWVDDMVVNGATRNNTYAYWEAGDACMIISSLATER